MLYKPRGDAAIDQGDKNLFYTILAGSRTGDLGNKGSYDYLISVYLWFGIIQKKGRWMGNGYYLWDI